MKPIGTFWTVRSRAAKTRDNLFKRVKRNLFSSGPNIILCRNEDYEMTESRFNDNTSPRTEETNS